MRLRPIGDRVIVELDPLEADFGDSGLARPDIAMDKPRWGTVRGVGPGIQGKRGFVPTTLRPGQRVYVPWAKGHDMSIGGRPHVVVHEYGEGDVLAVQE